VAQAAQMAAVFRDELEKRVGELTEVTAERNALAQVRRALLVSLSFFIPPRRSAGPPWPPHGPLRPSHSHVPFFYTRTSVWPRRRRTCRSARPTRARRAPRPSDAPTSWPPPTRSSRCGAEPCRVCIVALSPTSLPRPPSCLWTT
jgi:hypothetical protein